jgi:hypothetical protein
MPFFCQVEKWLGDVRECPDEPPVEVREAKELPHVLLVLRLGPSGDTSNLDRVHLDVII